MTLPNLYGLAAQGVLLWAGGLWLARHLPRRWRSKTPLGGMRQLLGAALLLLGSVPLGDTNLLLRLRGLIGDPSLLSTALVVLWIGCPQRLPAPPPRPWALALGLGLGVGLYGPLLLPALPPTLGLYGLGWSQAPLLIASLSLAVTACWAQQPGNRWPPLIGLSLLGWGLGLMESSNEIDALVDPFLVLGLLLSPWAGGKTARAGL